VSIGCVSARALSFPGEIRVDVYVGGLDAFVETPLREGLGPRLQGSASV
jgi:hypothetical protein